MNIIIDNNVIIKNPDDKIIKYCKDNLILPNPDFYKKQRMGKWTGNTPSEIWLYERNGNDLWIPFGCLGDLWRMYPDKALYEFKIKPIQPLQYQSNINLYDYQKEAVDAALRRRNGVLVMPCGSGKTQCGIEIISRLKGRALWLTHTQDLLNQSMTRAKNVLDIKGTFGTITGGKVNLGTHITFATVQTMCSLDLDKYKDCFDIIVVDECQRCAGSPTKVTQFYKVVSKLSARYKYGLTATPKRADGLEKSMFVLLGDVIHEVSKDAVKDTTCPIVVKKIDTGYTPDYDAVLLGDGTLDYNKIIDNMIHDEDRFDKVLKVVNNLEGPVLVLANRVEYIRRLHESYDKKSVCLSILGNNKLAKRVRKESLKKLNDGELDCIFATYQLAKEGLDVPNLRYVVFATPEKDETTVVQSVGRVGRKFDGKDYGTVIDFVDDFGMYKAWSKKRDKYYKKLDASIYIAE
ncbi:MAG TPA: DNA or RNA helicase of superfamily II [Erysipelotrichaceae bacterium]|nr:DNA or RNA helicase of superfamily II [Erysipelotrichaceae bacterium]